MAELLPFNSRLGSYAGDLNELHKTAGAGISVWTILGAATNSPFQGNGGLLLNVSRYNINNSLSTVFQIANSATAEQSNVIICRTIHYTKLNGIETIGDWKQISLM